MPLPQPPGRHHDNEDSHMSTNCFNSFMDNNNTTKSIQSIRMELKNKHSRHIQDLKEYYEKELDELRSKLSYYENRAGDTSDADEEATDEENCKSRGSKQAHHSLNSELKCSNNALMNKLYKSGQHVRYLTQENNELVRKVKEQENRGTY